MSNVLSKVLFYGANKKLNTYKKNVQLINSLESNMKSKSDEELSNMTNIFKQRIASGESLDSILPEAFAVVREASRRTLGMRHFDVQLIGGMALNDGCIAEQNTGEGKTLVATLAAYLNALEGKGVHVVTVNDYLAKRDSQEMGDIYKFLGLTVGVIQNGMPEFMRKSAYNSDVTYGTNSEFGFDYLRDNMVTDKNKRFQRGHHFAIIDEVDSILIDEARTPLIISVPDYEKVTTYLVFAKAVKELVEDIDYKKDESKKTIFATEQGILKVEELTKFKDIYGDISGALPNYLHQALRAEYLFHKDVDYIVDDNQVKIIDAFTGRILPGRRWSNGLHQAVEAKEQVKISSENQTAATITIQNYFRMYEKLSGMSGTAVTEDSEFRKIYGLDVVKIPTNKPIIRIDNPDKVYISETAKYNAVADKVSELNEKGKPVLIGTTSIESSEKLSKLLSNKGIKHHLLNAKHHEEEAAIVAQAGKIGAVTIATNMAGRGTDIMLGGSKKETVLDILSRNGYGEDNQPTQEVLNSITKQAKEMCIKERDEVLKLGGLCVIGTERHESRRIDNQLRGRSGRQGDPGESQFYLSLEDDIVKKFGEDRVESVKKIIEQGGFSPDKPLDSKMVAKAIEASQHNIESINTSRRKAVLEYDDVLNSQREAIYRARNAILDNEEPPVPTTELLSRIVQSALNEYLGDEESLNNWVTDIIGREHEYLDESDVEDYLINTYESIKNIVSSETMKDIESQLMLRMLDERWITHLQDMDYLRTGIGLRSYANKEPIVEYRQEAYNSFSEMIDKLNIDFIKTIMRIEIRHPNQQSE